MENRAYESIHNSKTPFYSLFILIVIFISSLSLPFRFQSFGLKFTNFVDTNDRPYIFLLCICILFLIFLDYGTNQVGTEARMIGCDHITVPSVHDHSDFLNVHAQNEHVSAIEVKQSVTVDDVDDHHDDRIEDPETETETEMHLDVDDEHEMVANIVVEEEEHEDQEEAKVFQQKCEEFIKKVRQSMHHEGRPVTMIDFQESVD